MVRHLVDYVAIVDLICDDTHDLDLDDDSPARGKRNILTFNFYT